MLAFPMGLTFFLALLHSIHIAAPLRPCGLFEGSREPSTFPLLLDSIGVADVLGLIAGSALKRSAGRARPIHTWLA